MFSIIKTTFTDVHRRCVYQNRKVFKMSKKNLMTVKNSRLSPKSSFSYV